MPEEAEEEKVVHKHYHLWPKHDCSCAAVIIAFLLFATIETLARLDKLPW